MKKLLIIVIGLVLILLAGIYMLIPSNLDSRNEVLVNANPQGALRALSNEKNWKNWIKGTVEDSSLSKGKGNIIHNGVEYRISKQLMNGLEVAISDEKSMTSSILRIIPLSHDSSSLEWRSSIALGRNPLDRIGKYFLARKTGTQMNEILSGMKKFLEIESNIYDLDIFHRLTKDTVMMSTKKSFTNYPTTKEVYELIEKVRTYIKQENGKETNFPMLHIRAKVDSSYDAMVAIPINHSLPGKDDIVLKRMLFKGNLLETEVKGGRERINKGFEDITNYISDHSITPAAIPYEMLITDRSREPDTSKWVTKLFYPVY